jgi:tetratricopeptide (TPR) repeat protein
VTGQSMAENRMYLPLAAVAAGVALAGYAVWGRRALALLTIAAVVLGGLTFRRNQDYRSDISIWEDTVAKRPTSWRGHNDLGLLLAQLPGRGSEAIGQYEQALRLRPDLAELHFNLAVELAKNPGRRTEAIAHYEEAARLKPDWAEAHNNLANQLSGFPDRMPEAIEHYEQALRLKPDSAETHFNLANKLVRIPNRLPEAIAHYEQAVRLRPEWPAGHSNLAISYVHAGRYDDAVRQLELAIHLDPANQKFRQLLDAVRDLRR